MKVQARLISRHGDSAEVVVISGEGSARRSATRHIRYNGAVWTGNSPDGTARECNRLADEWLRVAELRLRKLEGDKKTTVDELEAAKTELATAQVTQASVQRNFPLVVEFEF